MLPSAHRMRSSAEFSAAVRTGRRARRGSVVLHLAGRRDGVASGADAARVGFVVGKSVGGSVVRHRVTRRLRAVLAARVGELPAGSALVVRALPESAAATSTVLAGDVDRALERLLGNVPVVTG